MIKKKVDYKDYNGKPQTEELFFHLRADEVIKLDMEFENGLAKYIEELDPKEEPTKVMRLFEKLITMAYGEKSEDGRLFLKSEESLQKFQQSAAYEALYLSLIMDDQVAAEFFAALVPEVPKPGVN